MEKNYLLVCTSKESVNAFYGYHTLDDLETSDLVDYIPTRKGQFKIRYNSDGCMDIVLKVN